MDAAIIPVVAQRGAVTVEGHTETSAKKLTGGVRPFSQNYELKGCKLSRDINEEESRGVVAGDEEGEVNRGIHDEKRLNNGQGFIGKREGCTVIPFKEGLPGYRVPHYLAFDDETHNHEAR